MKIRRPPRRAPTLLLLVLLGLSTSLGACGWGGTEPPAGGETGEAREGEPRRGGTVVSGLSVGIGSVNELLASTTVLTDHVLGRIFLNLLEEQPDFHEHPPTFAPQLAKSYEWSDDHKVLTFHLRDDVYWSDGVQITAEDVRWTWQAQTHPEVGWESAYIKENITDVEVVDRFTVRFHYDQVYSAQLMHANDGRILPKHAWGKLPFSEWRENSQWFYDNIVASGPFRMESWKPEEEVVLVRNERYFEPGLPYLDRAVFRVVPDQSSQIAQLRAGSLDFITNVPPDDALRIREETGLELDAYWSLGWVFIFWNNDHPLFEDPRVRRALTLAIDRQGIVDALWGEFAQVASSPVVPTVWAHNRDLEPHPYDPERARELLAEAGWRDVDGDGVLEKGDREFRFEILNHTGNRQREDATIIAQSQLARIGVRAEPRLLDIGIFLASIGKGEFEAALAGMRMPTDMNLRYVFHSDQIGAGWNYARYRDPRVDRLIDQAHEQREQEDMAPYLNEIQEIIHRQQPVTFLWYSKRINARRTRLRGVESNVISPWFGMRYWWVRPER